MGLLCTTTRFVDYELKLEFKADKGTNSGVFLRTPLNPSDPSVDCYELNIAPPDNPFPTGSLVARSKHELKSESTGWQNFHVTVSGGEITVVLNGSDIASLKSSLPELRLPSPLSDTTPTNSSGTSARRRSLLPDGSTN